MKAPDENDKLMAGSLEIDPLAATRPKPMNKAAEVIDIRAKREAENAPRILTVQDILKAAENRATRAEKVPVCTTGHHVLDAATGGIRPGHGWVFAAETNWGKSSWLISVADDNIALGRRPLIVSFEDDESIYGNRLLARRSGVRATRIRDQRLDDFDLSRVRDVVARAEPMPVFLDARGKTAEWTAKHVGKILDEQPIDVVLYDYLQECAAHRPQENHRLTVKYVAGILKKTVTMRQRACVIFSQLTEPSGTAPKLHPDKSQIRDCRDVANAAETIVLGYCPTKAIEKRDGTVVVPAGAKAIWIDKVKDGPKNFAIGLDWDDHTASFRNVPKPPGPYDDFDSIADPDGDARYS